MYIHIDIICTYMPQDMTLARLSVTTSFSPMIHVFPWRESLDNNPTAQPAYSKKTLSSFLLPPRHFRLLNSAPSSSLGRLLQSQKGSESPNS